MNVEDHMGLIVKVVNTFNPNDAKAHHNFANLLYDQEKYQESRKHLDEFNKLRGKKHQKSFDSLDEKLKDKGY